MAATFDATSGPQGGKRWYLDPVAVTVVLIVHGYALSAIAATWTGLTETSTFAIVIRLMTLAAAAMLMIGGIRLSNCNKALALLWLMYLVRLLYDLAQPRDTGADIALTFFVLSCVLPALAVAATRRTWDEPAAARGLLVTGGLILLGTLFISTFVAGGDDYREETGRLGFEKLNPISLGHIGSTTALAAMALSITASSRRQWLVVSLAVLLGMAIMVLAASRGPIIAFAICAVAFLARRAAWRLLLVVLMVVLAVVAVADLEPLLEQVRVPEAGTGDSSLGRQLRIEVALRQIASHWEFGSAYTLPEGLGYPHNIMVEAWMAMGFFGFALMVAVVLLGVAAALGRLAGPQPMIALIFLQHMIGAQFSGAFYGWPAMWLGLAVLLAGSGATPAPRAPLEPDISNARTEIR